MSLSQEQVSAEQIIAEEIRDMKQHEETMSSIILRAAVKLDKSGYYLSEIGAKLAKIFPNQSRLVQCVLPDKYKRGYHKTNQELQPQTAYQELFLLRAEALRQESDWWYDMFTKINKDSTLEQNLISIAYKDNEMRNVSHLIDQELEEVKNYKDLLDLAETLNDDREKVEISKKLIMKTQMRGINLRHVAELAGITSKWMKSDNYNRNNVLDNYMKLTKMLHAHIIGEDFKWESWLRENRIKLLKDRPIIYPTPKLEKLI